MHVVGHQTIAEYIQLVLLAVFLEQGEIEFAITVAEEDVAAIVSPLCDVMRRVRDHGAPLAWRMTLEWRTDVGRLIIRSCGGCHGSPHGSPSRISVTDLGQQIFCVSARPQKDRPSPMIIGIAYGLSRASPHAYTTEFLQKSSAKSSPVAHSQMVNLQSAETSLGAADKSVCATKPARRCDQGTVETPAVILALGDIRQWDAGVADAFALPGIGGVEIAVAGLDHGRIGELTAGLGFESVEEAEVLAIGADGEVER